MCILSFLLATLKKGKKRWENVNNLAKHVQTVSLQHTINIKLFNDRYDFFSHYVFEIRCIFCTE